MGTGNMDGWNHVNYVKMGSNQAKNFSVWKFSKKCIENVMIFGNFDMFKQDF